MRSSPSVPPPRVAVGGDLDPRRAHLRHEDRQSPVARELGIGANREVDPVGVLGARGPDLPAVDDEPLPVEDRPRAQRGQVRACLGLGEALAEDQLARGDPRQQPLDQLRRREAQEGVADRLHRQQVARQRQPVVAEHLLHRRGPQRVEAAASHGLRPVQADPPGPAEALVDVPRVGVGRHALKAVLLGAFELGGEPGGERPRLKDKLVVGGIVSRQGSPLATAGRVRDPIGAFRPAPCTTERFRRSRAPRRRASGGRPPTEPGGPLPAAARPCGTARSRTGSEDGSGIPRAGSEGSGSRPRRPPAVEDRAVVMSGMAAIRARV